MDRVEKHAGVLSVLVFLKGLHDLAAGRYELPWEKKVKVTDGTSCGFTAPTRSYKPVPTTLPPAKLSAE